MLRKSFNLPYLSLSNPPIWKIQIIFVCVLHYLLDRKALNELLHSYNTSGLCILMVLPASYERGEPPRSLKYSMHYTTQTPEAILGKSFHRIYLSLSNPPIWKIQIIFVCILHNVVDRKALNKLLHSDSSVLWILRVLVLCKKRTQSAIQNVLNDALPWKGRKNA
jgi:hypothetical protein